MVDISAPSSDGPHGQAPARPLGRFSLRQLLGRNEHSMAWLAFDPRFGHEVMLTMPRAQPSDAQGLAQWDARVRLASRLSHPHLAHVIEVGVEGHWPYVMVDRALGVTLDEWLMTHPPPSPMEVVVWLCQALEGLAFAHDAGVVHGHIEAYTLVISDSAQVRWMGLGAAALGSGGETAQAHHQMDVQSLQTQRLGAARDILSLGVLLHRLLSGQLPLGHSEISSTLQHLPPQGNAQLQLPRQTPQPVSEALRAIANRATAGQQRQRYLNARSLLRALEGWRESETQGCRGPLEVLLDRIASVGHLPSHFHKARSATPWARWEIQRTDEIAQQILKDMGLSLDLLRQVNSSQVQSSQAISFTPVMTVRRAIALLGINGVRRSTQGLREWPGPLNESAAALLQTVMERVRLAGVLAQLLAPAGYDPEMIYIVTLLQNLGRLLVHYHFADEAEQIRHLMQHVPPTEADPVAHPGLSETAASFGVLGMNIEMLGALVAKHWHLGDDVQHMMHRLPLGRPVRAPESDIDWLRVAASAANELVDGLAAVPPEQSPSVLAEVAQRYARTLALDDRALQEALKQAREWVRKGRLVAQTYGALVIEPPAGNDQAQSSGSVKGSGSGSSSGALKQGPTSSAPSLRERLRAKSHRSE